MQGPKRKIQIRNKKITALMNFHQGVCIFENTYPPPEEWMSADRYNIGENMKKGVRNIGVLRIRIRVQFGSWIRIQIRLGMQIQIRLECRSKPGWYADTDLAT
jgi:hypothetical protein